MTTATQTELFAEADRAAAAGNLQHAERCLLEASKTAPPDLVLLLKLAAIQRATRQHSAALETVHQALALSPRDFTALLMRASLLDQLGSHEAGAAWTHALAQRPDGDLPANLEAVVATGERRAKEWTQAREAEMRAAAANAESRANPEELGRIARFCSNTVRRTRHFHSEPTEFHFPGLREREFHPRRLFPWLEELEDATEKLVAELRCVMAAERAELVPYVQYADHLPMDQWKPLNHNRDWTAIHLLQNGVRVEANTRHCPETMQLLERLPQLHIRGASPNAMFSLLAPHTTIPAHVGVSNARLVCHLPLVVPEGCWFRVGGETRHWKRGEAFVFDDTIEHEAENPTNDLRVVFIFDVWHPDLTPVEREALAALIGSQTAPGEL
jgi:aspartyl/asparaginyl beta-hydroxylase (cupin superfamily)